MQEENKEVSGWTYDYSDLLGMKIAYRDTGGGKLEAYTEDKTHYTWPEIKTLAEKKSEKIKQVHILKKLFKGEIVCQ